METRANYLMVGVFVLALAAGLVVFVIWLAKFEFETEFARYDIDFKGSVTGLKEGSPVRYSGVRVGEVIEIQLIPDSPDAVRVTIEIDSATPIRTDTVATLEIEGLTGGLYVLLSGVSADSPPLRAPPGRKRPVIASKPSTLQQVLEGAPEMIQKVNLLLTRANDLLNAENRQNLAGTLENTNAFTASLAEHSDELGLLIADASAAMGNLRGATGALEDLAVTLKGDAARLVERVDTTLAAVDSMASEIEVSVGATAEDARGLINELRGTAKSLSGMSQELEAMIAENREPVRDFTATGLSELTVLLIEMQGLVVALNRMTTELQRDPARFFFGNQQEGYETR